MYLYIYMCVCTCMYIYIYIMAANVRLALNSRTTGEAEGWTSSHDRPLIKVHKEASGLLRGTICVGGEEAGFVFELGMARLWVCKSVSRVFPSFLIEGKGWDTDFDIESDFGFDTCHYTVETALQQCMGMTLDYMILLYSDYAML